MTSPYLRETFHAVPHLRLDQPNLGPSSWPITVAILARDEQRCIRRCLDSVLTSDADTVLVLDTGSVDETRDIVASSTDPRIELVRHAWSDSFAQARNAAMDHARPGWIVFLDADEWFTDATSKSLRDCLNSFTPMAGVELTTLAPIIREADAAAMYTDLPRIMPTPTLRFRGAIHEYPYVPGHDVIPGLLGIPLDVMHDGYRPDVVLAKGKGERNLSLLDRAHADEPGNPRWIFYRLRDGLGQLTAPDIVDLCDRVAQANQRGPGDRRDVDFYHRHALAYACTRLAQLGHWSQVLTYCTDLDRSTARNSADAVYFRGLHELINGAGPTPHGMLALVNTRQDADVLAVSALDAEGRHLDALIATYLNDLKGRDAANNYLAMCHPWSDPFFDHSLPR